MEQYPLLNARFACAAMSYLPTSLLRWLLQSGSGTVVAGLVPLRPDAEKRLGRVLVQGQRFPAFAQA